MALLIRTQLATPDMDFVVRDDYNQLFTMHGTTMIFLVVVPIFAGFANYMVPLMIGAADMAFPRLNALSYWLFLFGGDRAARKLLRRGGCGTDGLDRVSAPVRRCRWQRPGPLDRRPAHPHACRWPGRSTSSRRFTTCARRG